MRQRLPPQSRVICNGRENYLVAGGGKIGLRPQRFKSVVRPRTLQVFNRATGNTRAEHTRRTRTVILPTLWSAGFVVPRQNDRRTDRRPNHPCCNFCGAGHARLISPHRQNDQDFC